MKALTAIALLALTSCAHTADWKPPFELREVTMGGEKMRAWVAPCHTLYARKVDNTDINGATVGNFQCCDESGACVPMPVFVVKPGE